MHVNQSREKKKWIVSPRKWARRCVSHRHDKQDGGLQTSWCLGCWLATPCGDSWCLPWRVSPLPPSRPPTVTRVSSHKDVVRSIVHGYFQSQFRGSSYKEVDRPTHDSIKREQTLSTVTHTFMTQYTIPIDKNQLPKLPIRGDVQTGWMSYETTSNTWWWQWCDR